MSHGPELVLDVPAPALRGALLDPAARVADADLNLRDAGEPGHVDGRAYRTARDAVAQLAPGVAAPALHGAGEHRSASVEAEARRDLLDSAREPVNVYRVARVHERVVSEIAVEVVSPALGRTGRRYGAGVEEP